MYIFTDFWLQPIPFIKFFLIMFLDTIKSAIEIPPKFLDLQRIIRFYTLY